MCKAVCRFLLFDILSKILIISSQLLQEIFKPATVPLSPSNLSFCFTSMSHTSHTLSSDIFPGTIVTIRKACFKEENKNHLPSLFHLQKRKHIIQQILTALRVQPYRRNPGYYYNAASSNATLYLGAQLW